MARYPITVFFQKTKINLDIFKNRVRYSSGRIVHILLWFVVFYKLIPAHNVFVLYISQYLTFALHFVGQGPVSMYNNFIYAIGFSQHFNGFNWIHILLDIYCIHSTLHFIDVSLCSVPPRPIALSSLLSRCWSLGTSSCLSNSSEQNKWSLRPPYSLSQYQTHYTKLESSWFLH